jgi:hypothetical protein
VCISDSAAAVIGRELLHVSGKHLRLLLQSSQVPAQEHAMPRPTALREGDDEEIRDWAKLVDLMLVAGPIAFAPTFPETAPKQDEG